MVNPPRSHAGITLLELLLALSLGLLIVTGMGILYLKSTISYRQQQALARLQENARQAFVLLGHDIRMAGNTGCAAIQMPPLSTLNLLNQGQANWWSHVNRPLFGIDETPDEDTLGDDLFPNTAPGQYAAHAIRGDTFMVLRANTDDAPAWVTAGHDFGPDPITFSGSENGFGNGRLLLFSDCAQHSVLLQKTGPNNTTNSTVVEHTKSNYISPQRPGNCKTDLQGSTCDATEGLRSTALPARLWALSANAYYIRYSPRHYPHSPDKMPSLYRQTLGSSNNGISTNAEDLISGVIDMQIAYGIDQLPTEMGDGALDAYLTAGQIDGTAGKDWSRVKSVQITLTLESEDDSLLNTAQTWTYHNGHSITDQRLRHRYTQTFAIRNRL